MTTVRVSTRPLVKSKTRCRNFQSCPYGDSCMFYHPPMESKEVSKPVFNQKDIHTEPIVDTTLVPCRFGMGCTKGMACKFFHGEADDDALTAAELMILAQGHKLEEVFGMVSNESVVDNDFDSDDEDPFAEFEQNPDAYTEEMASSA